MIGLAPSLAIAVAAVWFVLGFRDDLLTALVTPMSVARIVLTGLLGIIGIRLVLLLARPDGGQRARFWPLTLIAGAALGLLLWAFIVTPQEARQMAVVGKTMMTCLIAIPLLSVGPVATLLYVLKRGASTTPAQAGWVAGLAGAGLSAAIYALYCTEDSPLFYVTWYGLSIIGVALVSRVIGARCLRW